MPLPTGCWRRPGRAGLREKALALLTARPMSRRELIDRLTACPRDREKPPLADEAQAAETADWLERLGLLNDAEYARTVVRHYSAKGYGPYKVRDELYRRGVARELWEDALAETADPVCGHRRLPAPEAQGRPDRPPGAARRLPTPWPAGATIGRTSARGCRRLGCGYRGIKRSYRPLKIAFISLGCDKNRVNTEQMMALCRAAGHEVTGEPDGADVAVRQHLRLHRLRQGGGHRHHSGRWLR